MKATIERATLLKGLSHVQSVVERRNTIPILSNVLLEATSEGALRMMATDLDLQINESVAAAVDTPGSTTVSAHTLFDIARKLPEGAQVSLTAAEGRMAIVAGRARFSLGTLPRDDFPVIAEGELPTQFELPAETLKQVIDKNALRDLDRRDALLSQRHLLACRRRRQPTGPQGGGDRRAPPGAGHDATSRRRRRDARRDRAA